MATLTLELNVINGNVDDLELLAESLERLTNGGPIRITNVVQIQTENMPAFFMLKDLLKAKETKRDAVGTEGSAAVEVRQRRSWTVDGEEEKISKAELHTRLETHALAPGQKVHHPKFGWAIVVKVPGQADELKRLEKEDPS
jgi:hypothetical protein